MEATLEEKYYRLKELLAGMGSVLLAYSGGVDSTLVLEAGRAALGENIVAVTIHSPLHPKEMLEGASQMAARLRTEHITIDADELADQEFTDNPPQRCYVCKHYRLSRIIEVANREGIDEVVDGSQLDDLGDYRPGMEAAEELGVRSPLLECEFQKYEVRAVSRELGLSTWNMPAATCFATRVPYGERVTREKVSIIDRGERFLADLGLTSVRLRFIEDRTARIEVSPPSIERLASEGVRDRVVRKMRELGFIYVTLDLAGYRSGALNEVLGESGGAGPGL